MGGLTMQQLMASGSLAVLAPPAPSTNILSVYQQGSNDFLKDIAAGLIKKLSNYLTTNVKQFNQLHDALPLVERAVEMYKAQEYNESITQSFQVYLFITALRANTPALPSL
jgi:hypothetical protein